LYELNSCVVKKRVAVFLMGQLRYQHTWLQHSCQNLKAQYSPLLRW
jgi:hypothetical protein